MTNRHRLFQKRSPERFATLLLVTTGSRSLRKIIGDNSFYDDYDRTPMKILTVAARVLLGLMFTVFGLNIFLHFLPMGKPPTDAASAFFVGLSAPFYIQVVGSLQVVGGVLLLTGRYVPLGLTLLGPVIVNIDLYHLFLAPVKFEPAVVVSVLALFLLVRYRSAFAGLLTR